MAIVVTSGLVASAETQAYLDSDWAWLKALLGLSVFEATLTIVGSSSRQGELITAAVDPSLLDALLPASGTKAPAGLLSLSRPQDAHVVGRDGSGVFRAGF